jgi:ABC-2 type transport system permease protein
MYPIETMPPVFQTLTLLNPLRHFLEIVRGIFLKGHGLLEIRVPLTILTAMAAMVLVAAAVRFGRSVR